MVTPRITDSYAEGHRSYAGDHRALRIAQPRAPQRADDRCRGRDMKSPKGLKGLGRRLR